MFRQMTSVAIGCVGLAVAAMAADSAELRTLTPQARVARVAAAFPKVDAAPQLSTASASYVELHQIEGGEAALNGLSTMIVSDRLGRSEAPLREWVRRNSETLSTLEKIADAPRWAYKVDTTAPTPTAATQSLGAFEASSCRVLAMRANLAANDGDWDAAYADNIRLHRIAGHLLAQPSPFSQPIGRRVARIALRQSLAFLSRKPPADPAAIAETLRAAWGMRPDAEAMDLVIAATELDFIEASYAWAKDPSRHGGHGFALEAYLFDVSNENAKPLPRPFRDVEELRAAMGKSSVEKSIAAADAVRALLRAARTSPIHESWRGVEALREQVAKASAADPLQRVVHLMPDLDLFESAFIVAQRAAVELVLAVRIYETKEKSPPADAAVLAPGTIPALPIDPFSGKPLVYEKAGKGFRIYSIGPDGKDDGGKDGEWRRAPGDFVFWPPNASGLTQIE
ncbi:MAG: hypothetical protein HRU75_08005 [Planctomycetia bacterium]|nr:MAG: hypothetical protein HRU75_08005 [Planctomycetia bacterium]